MKETARQIAEQYRVDRATMYRDARFAAALDRLAEVCGDQVRQLMLSRGIKLTRGDVERLPKLQPAEQQRIVAEVLQTGKRPKWPAPAGPKTIAVSLPSGEPEAQAHVLERRLGRDGTASLYQALGRLLHGQGPTDDEETK